MSDLAANIDLHDVDPAMLAQLIREQKALERKRAELAAHQKQLDQEIALKAQVLSAQKTHSAATSHLRNDQYMQDFDKGWNQLMAEQQGHKHDKGVNLKTTKSGKAFLIGSDVTGGNEEVARPDSRQAMSQARTRNLINFAKTTASTSFCRRPATVLNTWRSGPEDNTGICCDISDRPSLCSAANWSKGEIVVGSSDHALYVIDAVKGTKKRQLYNKTSGHQEWVTSVACIPDGKVISGGMDSTMWLWPVGTTRGLRVEGHSGPISNLQWDGHAGMVVSTSYGLVVRVTADKTVRLWQCGTRAEEKVLLLGHDAPIMQLDINSEGSIITGDRSGHVIMWDTTASNISWRMKNVHKGQVSALAWCDSSDEKLAGLFMSGGQDGYLRVWDHRARTNPEKIQLHVNEQGKGAVSKICADGAAAASRIVTCGADMTLRVLDPRKSFGLMSTITLPDFPYSLSVAGGLAMVGCGDGSLSVVDITAGELLYTVQAHQTGAVRCIEACADRLFTSGDDGNTKLFKFGSTQTEAEASAGPSVPPSAPPSAPAPKKADSKPVPKVRPSTAQCWSYT